ncbi:hypothetical protein Tco_0603155 [Tanacetum coccineum]
MADENVPAPAPTRSDDQILPFAAWVPIGKSNFARLLDMIGPDTYPTKKGRKDKPHVIPYCWFTKLIICHLGRIHNLHQRSKSLLHLAEEDLYLGNLKFVPKGEDDEVFRMLIPNELITNNIRNAPYYNAYMEMVAKHDRKIAAEKGGKKKPATAKQLKPKPVKEKSIKPTPAPKPKDDASVNIVCESPSPANAEIGTDTNKTNSRGNTKILQIGEEQGDDVANMVNLEEKAAEIDEGQAGSDPGKTPESRTPPDDDKMEEDQARPDPGESRVALARPNSEPTYTEKTQCGSRSGLHGHCSYLSSVFLSSTTIHTGPYFEQPVEDVPMPDTTHISDSEDTDSDYLLKIKPRLEWLKPIPEEDIPATTEPD